MGHQHAAEKEQHFEAVAKENEQLRIMVTNLKHNVDYLEYELKNVVDGQEEISLINESQQIEIRK